MAGAINTVMFYVVPRSSRGRARMLLSQVPRVPFVVRRLQGLNEDFLQNFLLLVVFS